MTKHLKESLQQFALMLWLIADMLMLAFVMLLYASQL